MLHTRIATAFFAAALGAAELVDTLKGAGPFTVFALAHVCRTSSVGQRRSK